MIKYLTKNYNPTPINKTRDASASKNETRGWTKRKNKWTNGSFWQTHQTQKWTMTILHTFVTRSSFQSCWRRFSSTMTSKQITLCLLEKTVFFICACMLLLQIFLSFKNFQRHDHVETYTEDHMYNVDMPLIVLCAETPFKPSLKEIFFIGLDDQNKSFTGWTVENVSTHNYIKSKATAQNLSDLLKVAWLANTSWSGTYNWCFSSKQPQPDICHYCHPWLFCTWGSIHL